VKPIRFPQDCNRLDIADGAIRYHIVQQDGSFVEMKCPDTLDNRRFVQFVQHVDNYRTVYKQERLAKI
jgi:hypothetical protein